MKKPSDSGRSKPGLPTLVAFSVVLVLVGAATARPLAAEANGAGGDRSAGHLAPRPSTIDDRFAELGRRVPGFGGMFYDDRDALNVYLSDPSPAAVAAARSEIATEFGREVLASGGLRILKGQYGFRELKAWHDRIADVLALPGVVLTDIDDRENRLTIGVTGPEVRTVIERYARARGIPLGAVRTETMTPFQLRETTLQDEHLPLVGGLRIVRPTASGALVCTLGFNAELRDGTRGFLTNSHCTKADFAPDGARFFQGTHQVGTEVADPRPFTGTPCPQGRSCRYSDSAFLRMSEDIEADPVGIARPRLDTIDWNGEDTFRAVPGDPAVFVGLPVTKVGERTGRTEGRVTRTCVDVNRSTSPVLLLCQATATNGADIGDSGSAVFSTSRSDPNRVEVVGILWGGGQDQSGRPIMAFSPIQGMRRDLGSLALFGQVSSQCSGATIVGSGDIEGTDGDDVILGSDGDDVIIGRGGQDLICGEGGNDYLWAEDPNYGQADYFFNALYGGPGDDFMWGGEGQEYMDGGDGDDKMTGLADNDSLWGDAGSDVLFGTGGNDYLVGGDGGDILDGEWDDDRLIGESGDDTLRGGPGDDENDGGVGNDTAQYLDAPNGIQADLSTGQSIGDGTDTLNGVENLIGSRQFNNVLVGDDGPNLLVGGDGQDEINGAAGDDLMSGNDGDDILEGNADDDTIHGGPGEDFVDGGVRGCCDYTPNTGSDILYGDSGNDVLWAADFGPAAIYGGPGDDILRGLHGDDWLRGNGGADRLLGYTGNDYLDARDDVSGNDSADGGPDEDTCEVDDGDVIIDCEAP